MLYDQSALFIVKLKRSFVLRRRQIVISEKAYRETLSEKRFSIQMYGRIHYLNGSSTSAVTCTFLALCTLKMSSILHNSLIRFITRFFLVDHDHDILFLIMRSLRLSKKFIILSLEMEFRRIKHGLPIRFNSKSNAAC